MENGHTWYIIVNPASGNWKVKKRWPRIQQQLLEAGVRFEAVFTERRGHAIELAREAVESGWRHILAVGGDGTNNETINGILQQKAVPASEVCFALLPVGTGNDWVRTLGIPKKIPEWLEMFQNGNTSLQDVGIVEFSREGIPEQRYFVNVAGMSFDAYVAKFMDENRNRFSGRFTYLLSLVKCLAKYKLPPTRIHAGDFQMEGPCYTVNAGICRYSGGGMLLVPHAVPDDGLLALTVARRLTKFGVLWATPLFYNGKIARHRKVHTLSARDIRVEPLSENRPIGLEADGEFLGYAPVSFSLLEKALRVLGPRNN